MAVTGGGERVCLLPYEIENVRRRFWYKNFAHGAFTPFCIAANCPAIIGLF